MRKAVLGLLSCVSWLVNVLPCASAGSGLDIHALCLNALNGFNVLSQSIAGLLVGQVP